MNCVFSLVDKVTKKSTMCFHFLLVFFFRKYRRGSINILHKKYRSTAIIIRILILFRNSTKTRLTNTNSIFVKLGILNV